jgi:5-keto 4-deoxyuronate isomerase family protein
VGIGVHAGRSGAEAIDKLRWALADSAEAEGPVVSCVEVERYARGFVLQHVHTDDRTLHETPAISDGKLVLVPRGCHPVGAPAGYRSLLPQRDDGSTPDVGLRQRSRPSMAADSAAAVALSVTLVSPGDNLEVKGLT